MDSKTILALSQHFQNLAEALHADGFYERAANFASIAGALHTFVTNETEASA